MNYVKMLFPEYATVVTLKAATFQTLSDGRQAAFWPDGPTDEGALLPASSNLVRYEAGEGISISNVLYLDAESVCAAALPGNRFVIDTQTYDVMKVRDYDTHKEVELNVVLI
jgi:hypothetical protein